MGEAQRTKGPIDVDTVDGGEGKGEKAPTAGDLEDFKIDLNTKTAVSQVNKILA